MLYGDRQFIDYDIFYRNYSFMNDMQDLWDLYCNNLVKENIENFDLRYRVKDLVDSVEVGLRSGINYKYNMLEEDLVDSCNDGSVTVCFSGGKDSLAVVLKLNEMGYKVNLFFVDGINRGFPEEKKTVLNIAEKLNLPIFIEKVKLTGKRFFIEHPLKNQMIATFAVINCLVNHRNPEIYFGDFKDDNFERSNFGVDWTDCQEVWDAYNLFLSKSVKGAIIKNYMDMDIDSYKFYLKHAEYIGLYRSCLTIAKYRKNLRMINERKYGIKLNENQCGSCWKCCMEYIYYSDNGVIEYNEEFYLHCLDILKSKYKELFSRSKVKPGSMSDIYEMYFSGYKFKDSIYYRHNGGMI